MNRYEYKAPFSRVIELTLSTPILDLSQGFDTETYNQSEGEWDD